MSAFEPVLVIALGSALGDAMVYPEVPILYARLIIVVMVGLDRLLGELQYRYKNINNFLSGIPRLMIRDGKMLEESLQEGNLRSEINHA